jgi:uncharacterized LabA/DUF88 family protein
MPHRTIVYVDGFNFYYGEVRGTAFKWLDPAALFARVLGKQNELLRIRYFTARIQPSTTNAHASIHQDAYLRALRAHCPLVDIHYGHFLRHRVTMENANPPPRSVDLWKNEEKGSDVNIALHVLNDAWQDACDCALVVSNDSDLAEALRLAKARHKLVGLVTPGAPLRKTSQQLRQHADFIRPVRTWMLRDSQLPSPIPGTTIRKPSGW